LAARNVSRNPNQETVMNSENLISIEDSELDQVAGGIGAALDLGRLGGASLNLGEQGVTATFSFFGHTLELGLSLIARFF
jgi:hypothetical protein